MLKRMRNYKQKLFVRGRDVKVIIIIMMILIIIIIITIMIIINDDNNNDISNAEEGENL